jgi:glycosyltransferase involved in cell wall biosynthesis
MIPISATIISYNEEKYIGLCLESLKAFTDEIIVVDSLSTDRTPEICKEHGVKFFSREFPGYRDQKNYATSLAKHDYIFSIDADEEVSSELSESLMRFKRGEAGKLDGYKMNRLNSYCGKWIRWCGWYPDRKLRLYNRNKGQWGGYNVHEVVVMSKGAQCGFLKGDLRHRVYDTIDEFAGKAQLYSTLSAHEYHRDGRKGSVPGLYYIQPGASLKATFLEEDSWKEVKDIPSVK